MKNHQSEKQNEWRQQVHERIFPLVAKLQVYVAKARVLSGKHHKLWGRRHVEISDPHERLMDYQ